MSNEAVKRVGDSTAAQAVVMGAIYLALAEVGRLFAFRVDDQAVAPYWPPAGLLVAVLLMTRWPSWPGWLSAALSAQVISDVVMHGDSPILSLGSCLAIGAEASCGAAVVRWVLGASFSLQRLKDVLALAAGAALLAPMAGATLAASVTAWSGAEFTPAWLMWWRSHVVGVLVFAPVIVGVLSEPASARPTPPWRRRAEAAAVGLGTTAIAFGIYGGWIPPPFNVPIMLLPLMIWAALRFGPRVVAVLVVVVAVIGMANASQGRGPYAEFSEQPHQRLLRVQGTLGIFTVSVLLLAAVVAERKRAEELRMALIAELEQALQEIKTLRGLIPLCAWCKKIRNDQGGWQALEDYLRAHTEAEVSHGMCPECLQQQMAALTNNAGDR